MKNSAFILILISLIFSSCTKDKLIIDPDNLLIGVWNNSDYMDNAIVYVRSQEFDENPGIKFNPDGTLIERKNGGWCGTPPISYADYPGNWTIQDDTLITVNVGYWGGTTTYMLDIESVTPTTLKVVFIPESD